MMTIKRRAKLLIAFFFLILCGFFGEFSYWVSLIRVIEDSLRAGYFRSAPYISQKNPLYGWSWRVHFSVGAPLPTHILMLAITGLFFWSMVELTKNIQNIVVRDGIKSRAPRNMSHPVEAVYQKDLVIYPTTKNMKVLDWDWEKENNTIVKAIELLEDPHGEIHIGFCYWKKQDDMPWLRLPLRGATWYPIALFEQLLPKLSEWVSK